MSNPLTRPEFADLLSHRRSIAAGEIVFLEGQPADAAYVVLQGEVQVTLTDSKGAQIIINHMRPGEIFGELELLNDNSARTATVLSKEGCELLVIDKATVDRHIANADPFLRFMIGHLCGIIRGWTDLAKKT